MAVLEILSEFVAQVDKAFSGSVKKDTALLAGRDDAPGMKGGRGGAMGGAGKEGKGAKALSEMGMLAVSFRRLRESARAPSPTLSPTDPVPRGQLWPTGSVGAGHRVSR